MDPSHGGVTTDGAVGPRADHLRVMKRLVHDLNNTLSVVSVNVALLQSGRDVSVADDQAEAIDEAALAAKRAATLTSQISRCISEMSDALPATRRGPARRRAATKIAEGP